jgi:hypothetical protein
MKTIKWVFSILALTLSGCAYNGYQRSYAGYSGGYGVQGYYDYPVQTYYRPTGVIRYHEQYITPRYPSYSDEHSDWHHDNKVRHRDRDWEGPKATYGHVQGNRRDDDASRWKANPSRHSWQQQSHGLERKWETQAQRRQDSSGERHSWQSDQASSRNPTSGRIGHFQRGSSGSSFDRDHHNHSQR